MHLHPLLYDFECLLHPIMFFQVLAGREVVFDFLMVFVFEQKTDEFKGHVLVFVFNVENDLFVELI